MAFFALLLRCPNAVGADDLSTDLLFLEFLGMSSELDSIGYSVDEKAPQENDARNTDNNESIERGNE